MLATRACLFRDVLRYVILGVVLRNFDGHVWARMNLPKVRFERAAETWLRVWGTQSGSKSSVDTVPVGGAYSSIQQQVDRSFAKP